VVLRSAGSGVVIANNVINNVQAGVFVKGATSPQVTGNTISNVDALNGIQAQGSVAHLYAQNEIFHVGPIKAAGEGCGIQDITGTNSSANTIQLNWVNDAYCGIAYVSSDILNPNYLMNTLYSTLNVDLFSKRNQLSASGRAGGRQ
jgi:parallel beta-helix repeat protein